MRILFLTTRIPFSTVGGERLRPFSFIKYLSRTAKIKVLSFCESESEKSRLVRSILPGVQAEAVVLPRSKSYAQCLLGGALSDKPLQVAYYRDSRMQKLVSGELSSGNYDIIFCHLLRMASYVQQVRTVRKVLDFCDVLSLRYRIACGLRKDFFKPVEFLEAGRLRKYESEISRKFDATLISSEVDKRYMEETMGIKGLRVIENGVEPEMVNKERPLADARKIVLFGNMRTFHNRDAAENFYIRIFPLIKARFPDARFVIVGANMPVFLKRIALRDSAVSVFADVEDIHPYVKDAAVSVAPMRLAFGMQTKIVQSMAYGLPVVTTSCGLGGMAAQPDRDILLADRPEDFAQKVIALMQDEDKRRQLIRNADTLINERYLWPKICQSLNDCLEGLLR